VRNVNASAEPIKKTNPVGNVFSEICVILTAAKFLDRQFSAGGGIFSASR